jgi:hypothetical protein
MMKTTKNIFFYFLLITLGINYSCSKADISEVHLKNEITAPPQYKYELLQCEGTVGQCGDGGSKYMCAGIGVDCTMPFRCICPNSKINSWNDCNDMIEEKGIPVTEEMIRDNYSDFMKLHESGQVKHPEALIRSRK